MTEIRRGDPTPPQKGKREPSEAQIRRSWERGFTNPLRHRDKKFRYLVHGILGQTARGLQRKTLPELGPLDPSQDIDLLRDPTKIDNRKVILGSVIDQAHTSTWGNRGFILSVPFDNIVAVYPEESGTLFTKPDELLAERGEIPTVEKLLEQTGESMYNEVVMQGTTQAGAIRPIGVFAFVDKEGYPLNPLGYREITLVGVKHDLPFVEIVRN